MQNLVKVLLEHFWKIMAGIAGLYAGFAMFYNLQAQGPKNDEKNHQQDLVLEKHELELESIRAQIEEHVLASERNYQRIELGIAELKVLTTRNSADLQQITNRLWK